MSLNATACDFSFEHARSVIDNADQHLREVFEMASAMGALDYDGAQSVDYKAIGEQLGSTPATAYYSFARFINFEKLEDNLKTSLQHELAQAVSMRVKGIAEVAIVKLENGDKSPYAPERHKQVIVDNKKAFVEETGSRCHTEIFGRALADHMNVSCAEQFKALNHVTSGLDPIIEEMMRDIQPAQARFNGAMTSAGGSAAWASPVHG